jgi:hypothetical protein
MPVGRAGKASSHPFAMIVRVVVEKSGGIVEEKTNSTTQHGDAKKNMVVNTQWKQRQEAHDEYSGG